MTERHLVVDQLKLSYEGLFDFAEFYRLIASWFYEKGWDWYEPVNQEAVTSSGRQIRIVLEPWKGITDYFKIIIKIKVNFIDVKDVEVEQDSRKIRINQGEIKMILDGYVISDRLGLWKKSPFYWFLGILFSKYFFKEHYNKAERWLLSDVDDLYQKMKSFLNVYRYSHSTTPARTSPVRY